MAASPASDRRDPIAEEIGFYLICLIAALLPLSFWPLVYRGFSLPKAVAFYSLVAALTALLTVRLYMFGAKAPTTLTALLLGIYCLSLAPSALNSISPSTAFLGSYRQLFGWLSWLAPAALAFGALMTAWDEGRLRDLMLVIAGVTAIVSAAAWAQYFWPEINQIWHIQVDRRPVFGTFGNAGYLAAFLAFALPVLLALALEAKRSTSAIIYGLTLILAAGALGFSGSRGGWVAAGAALALGAPAFARLGIDVKRLIALLAVGMAAFAAALLLPPAGGGEAGLSRLSGDTSTLAAQAGYWRAAARATARRPLTGAGPDTFGLVYPELATRHSQELEPETVTDDAHNLWLQMAATLGVIPPILLLALLINAFPARRSVPPDGRFKLLVWGFAAGVAGYLLALQTTVNSWGTAFIPWLFIGLMGSIAGRAAAVDGSGRWWSSYKKSGGRLPYLIVPVILALTVFGLFRLAPLWRADGLFLKAQTAPESLAPQYYRQAARVWPTGEFYWLNLAKSLARRDPRAAEAAAGRAQRAAPRSFLPHQFLAQFYLSDGAQLPKSRFLARKAAGEALKRFPNSPKLKKLSEAAQDIVGFFKARGRAGRAGAH